MSFLITPEDLPGANLATDVRLSAGRGWLPLMREALPELANLKILAIREDAGALVIDTTRCTEAQRVRLAEVRGASLHVCELCGQAGELVYEGLKDGRPAGWHRTRCPAHRDWRTCPPFPPGQARGQLDRETEAAARRFLSLIADRYDIGGENYPLERYPPILPEERLKYARERFCQAAGVAELPDRTVWPAQA